MGDHAGSSEEHAGMSEDHTDSAYTPLVSAEYAETLRRWNDAAYEALRGEGGGRVSYLGIDLDVPAGIFPPARMSALLGRAILADVRPDDRVLDMGTGSGVNAILAASKASEVVGVDINPDAVAAAAANAARGGVSDRITFRTSDVFNAVEGRFDLIIFDPPFRWFAPRDMLEAAMADENYGALTRFMAQARQHLTARGRILLFFGTTGDIEYLYRLIERHGFARETVDTEDLTKDGLTVSYYAFRLTPSP
jgi:release factor glutamine methyltransferase